MPGREPRRLLILGGTGEGAALARATSSGAALAGRLEVVTSLAGRTRAPAAVPGEVRVGGFGGADGLADYLVRQRIDLVVAATHPFAATISANARDACARAGVGRLILARPPWRRRPDDRWIEVDDAAQAAAELADHVVVSGRGPFTVAGERRLLTAHRIDVVVSKASGGDATYAKIAAAREMELPVIMVRRPPAPQGERVTSVAAALAWIANRLGGIGG